MINSLVVSNGWLGSFFWDDGGSPAAVDPPLDGNRLKDIAFKAALFGGALEIPGSSENVHRLGRFWHVELFDLIES